MHVLVTGAAGAVGHQVVKHLIRNDHSVIVVDLPKYRKMFENIPNVTFHGVDLNESIFYIQPGLAQIKKLSKKHINGIINCAAIVDVSKSYDEIKELNTHFPYYLRKTFEYTPFVHISSGSIYRNIGKEITEINTFIKTSIDAGAYELSKLIAEHLLLGHFSTTPMKILRPALIYGPNAGFLGAALAAVPPIMKDLGLSSIGFKGGPQTNWVHAEDVARAAVWALRRGYDESYAEIFNVCDDIPYAFGDTITDYMKAYGLNVKHTIPLPSPKMLHPFRKIIENKYMPLLYNTPVKIYWELMKSHYKLKGRLNVSIDKDMIPYMFNNTLFSNKKVKKCGFKFLYKDSKEEIKNTIDWYKRMKWIP